MFLRSLTLKGFKSFADTTTLELEPGVTVVVGPNGSGKSNVVDAIAWVLGAQAPSAVRSQKMDDVIFAGTAKRAALGRAEVTLTIDNSAGLLPIEFTEVTITPHAVPDGDSEYAINGVPCRLLDIQELLSDTGVGRQQHVIVVQGQIDAVLNARPEDRRAIIEEAAGVLKYRRRKEKAERRLEATEGNLLRLQDLLREVRRQLPPLERQADAARRHGDLVAELAALRLHLAGKEITTLRNRLENTVRDRRSLEQQTSTLKAELAALDTEVLATQSRLAALGGSDVGDSLVRFESMRERARGLMALARGAPARCRARPWRLARRRPGRLARSRGRSGRERARRSRRASACLAARGRSGLAGGGRAGRRASRCRSRWCTARGGRADARAPAPARREASSPLDGARSNVPWVSSHVSKRGSPPSRRAPRSWQPTATCTGGRANGPKSSSVRSWRRVQRAEAVQHEAEADLATAQDDHRAADADRHVWSARAEALALALDQRGSDARWREVDGAVGALTDLVDVDEGWSAAFEAAVGDALTAVIVDGTVSARRVLAAISTGGDIGAVLAPTLERMRANPDSVLRSHVRSSHPVVEQLLDALLSGVIVVEGGWERALDRALAQPESIIVTRDGDRFSAGGWRLGAARSQVTAAALDEARNRAAAAADRATTAASRVAASTLAVEAAAHEREQIERELEENDAQLNAAADGLARVQAAQREVDTEAHALRSHHEALAESVGAEHARTAELEGVLPALEADEEADASRARSAHAVRARLDEKSRAVAALRTHLEVQVAGLDERRQMLRRRRDEVEGRLEADAAERERACRSTREARTQAGRARSTRLGGCASGNDDRGAPRRSARGAPTPVRGVACDRRRPR